MLEPCLRKALRVCASAQFQCWFWRFLSFCSGGSEQVRTPGPHEAKGPQFSPSSKHVAVGLIGLSDAATLSKDAFTTPRHGIESLRDLEAGSTVRYFFVDAFPTCSFCTAVTARHYSFHSTHLFHANPVLFSSCPFFWVDGGGREAFFLRFFFFFFLSLFRIKCFSAMFFIIVPR